MKLPYCRFCPSTPMKAALLMLAASVAILASAFVAQYGFGLHPCELCLLQRWPYAGVIVLMLLAIVFRHNSRAVLLLISIAGMVFLGESALAAYHAGVEYGLVEGPSGCSGPPPVNVSLEELRKAILEAPAVRCDVPAAVIFGLSMAGWNAIIAFGLSLYTLFTVLHLRGKVTP